MKTISYLEETAWAKEFKRDCPSSYKEALRFALNPNLKVDIYYNDEVGIWQYSLVAVIEGKLTSFWLDAKETKEEAEKLAESMGWEYYK